jgi:hypothetical protein
MGTWEDPSPDLWGATTPAPADASSGWWETQWTNAVDKFKEVWARFLSSKDTLSTAAYAVDGLDPDAVGADQVAAMRARADALTQNESAIDDVVSEAIDYIHAAEDKLGWKETQLGVFGVDDALVITAVVTAGVAAVGYYVYKITTHTQDVNQFSSELEALAKKTLTPDQLLALHQTRNASSGGGVVSEILQNILPYVGVGILGYFAWQAFTKRRT